MKKYFQLSFLVLALILGGCSGTGGGDNSPAVGTGSGSNSAAPKTVGLDCGVVQEGIISASVDLTAGEPILGISFIDPISAIVTVAEGERLVRLHGLSSAGLSPSAMGVVTSLAAQSLYLFRVSEACSVVFDGGGLGTKGNIITASGKSLTEEIIRAGYAGNVDTGGSCWESAMAPCYVALAETYTPEVPPTPDAEGVMSDFLWKPHAESNYNLGSPVIHVNPKSDVYVNGQGPVMDFGPGNGRAVTARLFKSCGSYGTNVKVEVFKPGTKIPRLDPRTGLPYVTVPSGCGRYEF